MLGLAQIPTVPPDALGNWLYPLVALLIIVGAVLTIAVQAKTLFRGAAKGQEPVLKSDLDAAVQEIEHKIDQIEGRVLPADKLVVRSDFDREIKRLSRESNILRRRTHKIHNDLLPVSGIVEMYKELKTQIHTQAEIVGQVQIEIERILGGGIWNQETLRNRAKKKDHPP